uniref:GPI transamidase component PIG-S n=1 Tax=Eutreptiella gymnastica TaxID=73025 RepID=A0A7S4CF83_9EUGL
MDEDDFGKVLHERTLGRHNGPANAGRMDIYFLSSNRSTQSTHAKVHIGSYRTMWVETTSLSTFQVQSFINSLREFFYSPPPPIGTSQDISLGSGFEQYHISLTLLNADPASWIVDWDVEAVTQYMLQPFLDGLSTYQDAGEAVPVDMLVDTQIVNHGTLPDAPEYNAGLGAFTMKAETMQRLLLVNDWKLNTFVNHRQSKILNFVVLIPSKEHCPLVLLDDNGQPTSSSFAFPEWGGVSVLCPREASKTQQAQGGSIPSYFLSAGDLTEVVTAFTMQIRQLLGITWSLATPPSWHYVGVVGPVPYWEMDLWHRQLVAKMTGQAIQATVKLHQLLQQLPAMPVSDGIAYTIARGINYISKTSRSGFYSFALERAQVALKQSENAFYDESLLAQLYFPEEHKLAVYVPFFLPLSMTLVLGCIHRLKQLKKSPKEDSVEQQQGDDQPGDGDPDAQVDEQ